MSVRHRPNIIQNVSDLENYYWLKNDLIKYAATHNLVTSGSKTEFISCEIPPGNKPLVSEPSSL